MHYFSAIRRLLGLLAISLFAVNAGAQTTDKEWLNEVIGSKVGKDGPTGASAVIIRKDGTKTQLSWGSTEKGSGQPIDSDSTVFRIGSISKSFTAIAIMQLLEEGKIGLDDDISKHLTHINIPEGQRPTKVVDLLSHRGGFDGDISYVGLNDKELAATSSNERLQRDLLRVRDPGLISVYDNLAWGLLGDIIEEIDGVPYAKAIERRVLQPLSMHHTIVGLPTKQSNIAGAYEVGVDGKPVRKPQVYLRRGWQGAGDISSTAGDMSRFLLALLSGGEHPGGRLMSAQTFRQFTDTTQFTITKGVPGTGLGVYELGKRLGGAFGHGGTIRGFNAVYMVLPEQGVAFFAVMNLNKPVPEFTFKGLLNYFESPTGRSALNPTDYLIFDVPYLAEQRWQVTKDATSHTEFKSDPKKWDGRYAYMRAEDNEALLPRIAAALFLPPSTVESNPDGSLTIDGTGPFIAIDPNVFQLNKPAGPMERLAGFAQVGNTTVMGPHTLLSNRRLSFYEHIWLTVGALTIAPLLLLFIAVFRRKVVGVSHPVALDKLCAFSTSALLLCLGLEIVFAQPITRLSDYDWLAHGWRIGMHASLLCLALSWLVNMPLLRSGWRAKTYFGTQSVLFAWLILGLLYWHVIGKF